MLADRRRGLRRLTRRGVVAAVVMLVAAMTAPANGSRIARPAVGVTGPLSWSRPLALMPDFARVRCRPALCLVTSDKVIVTSTSPRLSAGAWRGPAPSPAFGDISCPSPGLCVGVSDRAVTVTTDPTSPRRSWMVSPPLISQRIPGSPDHNYLTRIACASIHLCVAGDFEGRILISTHPEARLGAWSAPVRIASVDDDIEGISCASVRLCVAVTGQGRILTSTRPTGGRRAWRSRRAHISSLSGVQCPSINVCIAFDGLGNVVTSQQPTGGRRAWSRGYHTDARAQIDDIACPSVRLCVAVDGVGDAQAIDPSHQRPSWTAPVLIDPAPSGGRESRQLTSVGCISPHACVAADDSGRVIVGRSG